MNTAKYSYGYNAMQMKQRGGENGETSEIRVKVNVAKTRCEYTNNTKI